MHHAWFASFEASQAYGQAGGGVDLGYRELHDYLIAWEKQLVSNVPAAENATAAAALT